MKHIKITALTPLGETELRKSIEERKKLSPKEQMELKKLFTIWEEEKPLAVCFGVPFEVKDKTFFMRFQENAIDKLAPAQFLVDFKMTLEN